MQLVVVTGLSGAGKSAALKSLEDLGYFASDNLPPPLWSRYVGELAEAGVEKAAVVVDSRAGRFLNQAPEALEEIESGGVRAILVFLEARSEILLQRYNLSRRAHPLGQGHLLHEIEDERRLLAELRGAADWIIDTSDISPGELADKLANLLGETRPFVLRLISFGFKWGPPQVADLLLDARALPNPHWVDELRPLTGLEQEVAEYVFSAGNDYYQALKKTVEMAASAARDAGRSGYTVAVGCTGGRHRSVAVAERLAKELAEVFEVEVEHRDVAKDG
ncbi:RNase adapter RapZ [Oceanithermus sp.]